MREPRQRRGVLVVVLLLGDLMVALFTKPSGESGDVGQTDAAALKNSEAAVAAGSGDSIDFAVGPEGDYVNKDTPIRVTISAKAAP